MQVGSARRFIRETPQTRREALEAEIERGKQAREFYAEVDSELLVDSLIGPVYHRLLMKSAPND